MKQYTGTITLKYIKFISNYNIEKALYYNSKVLNLTYSHAVKMVHNWESQKLITRCITGRDTVIKFTPLGLKFKKMCKDFDDFTIQYGLQK